MKLLSCNIVGFGCLTNRNYEFSDQLNQICEENGWGKSTFAAFIRAMLFGLPDGRSNQALESRPREKYRPWDGGRFGGNLVIEVGDRVYRLERFFGAKEKDDTFRLYDNRTGLLCEDFGTDIGEQLFHVDRAGYLSSAFIGQNQIASDVSSTLTAKMADLDTAEDDMRSFDGAMKLIEACEKDYSGRKGSKLRSLKEQQEGLELKLRDLNRTDRNLEEIWKPKETQLMAAIARCRDEIEQVQEQLREQTKRQTLRARYTDYLHSRDDLSAEREHLGAMSEGLLLSQDEIEEAEGKLALYTGLREQLQRLPFTDDKRNRLDVLRKLMDGITDATIDSYMDRADRLDGLRYQNGLERERLEKERSESGAAMRKPRGLISSILFFLLSAASLVVIRYRKDFKTVLLAVAAAAFALGVTALICYIRKRKKRHARLLYLFEIEQAIGQRQQEIDELEPVLSSFLAPFLWETGEGNYSARLNLVGGLYTEYVRLTELEREDCSGMLMAQQEDIAGALGRMLHADARSMTEFRVALNMQRSKRSEYDTALGHYQAHLAKLKDFEDVNDMEAMKAAYSVPDESEQLREKLSQLLKEMEDLRDELEDCHNRMSELQDLAALKSEYEDRLTECLSAISEMEAGREVVTLTRQYLTEAFENFEEQYSATLGLKLKEYLAFLNESSGTKFGPVSMDTQMTIRFEEAGERRTLEYYSAGMTDLVQLCKRFAMIDVLYENESPFVILDDPFVNLDGVRLKKALELLKKISGKYQLIYFTCHNSRIADW